MDDIGKNDVRMLALERDVPPPSHLFDDRSCIHPFVLRGHFRDRLTLGIDSLPRLYRVIPPGRKPKGAGPKPHRLI